MSPSALQGIIQANIFKMETVEEDLLANKFPCPQYYDGIKWNTVTFNSRKSVPEYLKAELPNMKYQKVKTKFQEMNRFMPPEITYFQRIITTSNSKHRKSAKTSRSYTSAKKKTELQVQNLREDLQYALIMTNRNSNILVDLVEKVNSAEKRLGLKKKPPSQQATFEQKLMRTKRSQSVQLCKPAKECFSNTMDLVFSVKKKECMSRLNKNPELDLKEEIQKRINSIRLCTFEVQ